MAVCRLVARVPLFALALTLVQCTAKRAPQGADERRGEDQSAQRGNEDPRGTAPIPNVPKDPAAKSGASTDGNNLPAGATPQPNSSQAPTTDHPTGHTGTGGTTTIPGGGDEPKPTATNSGEPHGNSCNIVTGKRTQFFLERAEDPIPPAVKVTIVRKRGATTTQSICAGVAGMRSYDTVANGKMKYNLQTRFPRILLAKHCIMAQGDGQLTGLVIEAIDDRKTITYDIDRNGKTTVAGADGHWVVDLAALATKDEEDDCTKAQKTAPGQASRRIPCFTAHADRYELTSVFEQPLIEKRRAQELTLSPSELFARAEGDVSTLLGKGPTGAFDVGAFFATNQVSEIADFSAGSLQGLEGVGRTTETSSASRDELTAKVMAALNESLVRLRITRIVRAGDFGNMLLDKPAEGWGPYLELYLDWRTEKGLPALIAVGFKDSALRRLSDVYGQLALLKKGDSGTLLIGEFNEVAAPVATVKRYRRILGALSTVGGEPVCTGDDLTCCEKAL